MEDSIVTGLTYYYELEKKRYDYLTLAEQKIVRLGGAAIACQSTIDEYKKLRRLEDASKMEVMLKGFLSELEIAIAKLPENNSKSRS